MNYDRRTAANMNTPNYWEGATDDLAKFNKLYALVEKKPNDAVVLRKCINGINKMTPFAIWASKCLPEEIAEGPHLAARRAVFKLTKDKEAVPEALLEAIQQYRTATQDLVRGAAPEHFSYQGFKVQNPLHMSEVLCMRTLEGVDFLKALFKKRGVEPLLADGIAVIVLLLDAGAAAYFNSETGELVLSVGELSKGDAGRFFDRKSNETVLHEFGHYVHRNYIRGEARDAWDAPWGEIPTKANPNARSRRPEEEQQVESLEVVTDYGKTDKFEDFAETFMIFMAKPELLTPTAKFRMQRALSLTGLYGKPVMRLATEEAMYNYDRRTAADEGTDRSTNPTVVEYAAQTMMKGKSPAAAAKDTAKKFDGFENMFFGPGIARVDAKVLEEALWERLVDFVIKNMAKMKEGMGHFALDGTMDHFKQKPPVRREVKKRITAKLGGNPFPNDDR